MKFLFIMNLNIWYVSKKEWTTEYLSCPILLNCFTKICSIQFIYKKSSRNGIVWCNNISSIFCFVKQTRVVFDDVCFWWRQLVPTYWIRPPFLVRSRVRGRCVATAPAFLGHWVVAERVETVQRRNAQRKTPRQCTAPFGNPLTGTDGHVPQSCWTFEDHQVLSYFASIPNIPTKDNDYPEYK